MSYPEVLLGLFEVAPWLVVAIMALPFAILLFTMHGQATTVSGRLRIVVVERRDEVRKSLRRLIENRAAGRIVAEGTTGAEALQLVEQHLPDVVIMDVKMPVVDGVEATREIKERHPEIRVVAFGWPDDDPTGAIMRTAGASAHVVKGDSPDDIVAAIEDGSGDRFR